jgi:hypothetical protein
MSDDDTVFERACRYAQSREIRIERKDRLGHGSDGTVWKSSALSAVKALYAEKNYANELESYKRLKEAGIRQLNGFFVPELVDFDDELMIIEMSIVEPPYLLDFGKVYIDRPPPYHNDPQLMANAQAEWQEWFGKHWARVAGVLQRLENYGIYYVDPRPSNICTGEEDEETSG